MIAPEMRELTGKEAASLVLPLYTLEGNGITLRDSDVFFVGCLQDEVFGSVRFCVENETPMLRTMRIARKFQGQGFGRLLLKAFASYLDRHRVGATYCIPYAHLEKFYAEIGFKVVGEDSIPQFLRDRLRTYRNQMNSDGSYHSYLCMCRNPRD